MTVAAVVVTMIEAMLCMGLLVFTFEVLQSNTRSTPSPQAATPPADDDLKAAVQGVILETHTQYIKPQTMNSKF